VSLTIRRASSTILNKKLLALRMDPMPVVVGGMRSLFEKKDCPSAASLLLVRLLDGEIDLIVMLVLLIVVMLWEEDESSFLASGGAIRKCVQEL
jgi:hypothetical protein